MELRTVDSVIDALGGNKEVARLTDRTVQAVTNWRSRGGFAADTYVLMTKELRKQNLAASARLWKMQGAS